MPSTDTASDDLLERARRGDPRAHAALYRDFAPMVYSLAWRMLGSRPAAEDVLQDCFVEVIRKAEGFKGEGSIGGWIKRIAINKCLSHLRSPWIARRSSAEISAEGSTAMLPPNEVGAGDAGRELARHQELERALAMLSPTARVVVWLHTVEGYTHEEIGRLMGRSTSFSKSQLARSHRELRRILSPEEYEAPTNEAEPCLGVLKTV